MKYKGRQQSSNVEDRRALKKINNSGNQRGFGESYSAKTIAKLSDYSHLISYKKPKKSKKGIDNRG